MESGILLLMRMMLNALAEKLKVRVEEVAEYVVNNQDAWQNALTGTDDLTKWITVAANELDNAIFSTVGDLDCPPDAIADILDEALRESYWQKRLSTLAAGEQLSQVSLLRSRASWLWNASTGAKRRGFFSAAIGFSAGEVIAANATTLGQLLLAGETAVINGDPQAAGTAAIGVAEELLRVYPFACDRPEGWQDVVTGWLNGTETSHFSDTEQITFIQDGIVYRLVWAVEAVRTTLSALDTLPLGADGGNFALCLTYGAPNIPAALLQQAGLSSRTLAVVLVQQLNLAFSDNAGLRAWLKQVADGQIQPTLEGDDRQEWDRFVADQHRAARVKWYEGHGTYSVSWSGPVPPEGTSLRVRNADAGNAIEVLSHDFQLLGAITGKRLKEKGRCVGAVTGNDGRLRVTRFGP